MKCPKCDVELVWLYKPINYTFFTHRDEDVIATDYLMCPICEKIWKQWIETKVHHDEVEVDSLGETKNE